MIPHDANCQCNGCKHYPGAIVTCNNMVGDPLKPEYCRKEIDHVPPCKELYRPKAPFEPTPQAIRPMRFALIGAAGYIAPRHMRAIRDNGHHLVAVLDPHDSVGILDTFAPGARYFSEPERFDRHLYKLKLAGQGVDYVSVCSPNYLHDAHCRMAMRLDADVICEKPLTLTPRNLDALTEMERETGRRVWTVLQMRLNPQLIALRERLRNGTAHMDLRTSLLYIAKRGPWYDASWKGNEERSGGILANIGVHMFDLLIWLFGAPRHGRIQTLSARQASGTQAHEFSRGEISWLLSVDGAEAKRVLRDADGSGDYDLSDGLEAAHTKVYAETLAGRGWGLEDARPSIEWIDKLKTQWGP